MKNLTTTLFAVALATSISLLGCGSEADKSTASSTTDPAQGSPTVPPPPSPAGSKMMVGVVFDSGGRGDKSFNDSAYAGLQQAEKDLHVDGKTIDSKSEQYYAANLTGLADQGCKVIFAVGLAQADALKDVAPKYPNVKFGLVDGKLDAPNVRCLQFAEEQGSFLAGYAAALVTKTNKIGFVGGMDIPLIRKFLVGYEAGAKTAKPNIEILAPRFTSNWVDVGLGKAAAKVLFDSGADVVYHASGRCGLGVIDAAKDAKKWAIGVDGNQDGVQPGTVLTSMIKHVDRAVYNTIKDTISNTFTAGTVRYDLAAGGVSLTDFQYSKDQVGAANLAKLKSLQDDIARGKIVVPSTEEELAKFKAPVSP